MSDRLEVLALERQLLVARSGLCRLKLRSRSRALRDSLSWRTTAVAVATTPQAGRVAFDLALAIVGVRRAQRTILLAGRALALARLVRSLVAGAYGVQERHGAKRAEAGR